jgi:hypothetical protein
MVRCTRNGLDMLTIKGIKEQLKLIRAERVSILHSTRNFCRLLELNNAELMLSKELIGLLETQLNKKNNLRKVG